jgi:hypothetical protein
MVRAQYKMCFGMTIRKSPYLPRYACKPCYLALNRWAKGKSKSPFYLLKPMMWRRTKNHQKNCYICLTKVTFSPEKKAEYPEKSSSKKPVVNELSSSVKKKLYQ